MPTRYFSLQEAEALVPRLTEILGRALQLHAHLRRVVGQLAAAGFEVEATGTRHLEVESGDDVGRLHAHACALYEAVREDLSLIEDLGVEIHDVEDGRIHFRSLLDGVTEVLLSWRIGERHIRYYLDRPDSEASIPVEGHAFLAEPRPPV